jgi:hypothetical protein
MSADPRGGNLEFPQSLNRYAYVRNNPHGTDPTGLECVWDDGSYDSVDDPDTGSVGQCQEAGGTWIELGMQGGWSDTGDWRLAQVVQDIHNGITGMVSVIGLDGNAHVTVYDNQGRVSMTVGGGTGTYYGYYANDVVPVGTQSFDDPGGELATGLRQWQVAHPGLPLDLHDRYILQLSQQIDFMSTNWLGADTHERMCNGAQIMLVSWSVFYGPTLLSAPVEASAEAEEAYRLLRLGTSAGTAAYGLSGVCK